MQYYDLSAIIGGLPICFLVGVLTALLVSVERIVIGALPFLIKEAQTAKDAKIRDFFRTKIKAEQDSAPATFIGVITVFISYILLSYALLLGQIRLYVLLILLVGYFLARRFLTRYIEYFVRAILFTLVFSLGKVVFGFRKIFILILKKVKFKRKVEKGIDNRAEIL